MWFQEKTAYQEWVRSFHKLIILLWGQDDFEAGTKVDALLIGRVDTKNTDESMTIQGIEWNVHRDNQALK